jgi:thiol-disulfide isomerase/thioredoxin
MYDFTAAWCGPCRRMDRDFWSRADVIQLSEQFVCVKVNFDKEKGLTSKYSIRAIPNVVFTDPWGRGLLGHKGFGVGTEGEILDKIKFLPKDFSSLIVAGNTLEANDKDAESLLKFASFYQERKAFWLGNVFYERLLLVETDPSKRESVLLNTAFNFLRLGEPDEAVARFMLLQKEFPLSPQNDLYLYGLVLANANKDKTENAVRYAKEIKDKFPKSKYLSLAQEKSSTLTVLKQP